MSSVRKIFKPSLVEGKAQQTENSLSIFRKKQDHFRVGISVSKRLGNAVTRNAIKRKIRHILMEFKDYLKEDDFVVVARRGVEELDYQALRQNLKHVLKLAKLLEEGFESEKEN